MDALVVPTHGEGWGRPQLEVRFVGLHSNYLGLLNPINPKMAPAGGARGRGGMHTSTFLQTALRMT